MLQVRMICRSFHLLLVLCVALAWPWSVSAAVDAQPDLLGQEPVIEFPENYFPDYLSRAVTLFTDKKCKKARAEIKKLLSGETKFLVLDKIYLLDGLCLRCLKKKELALAAFQHSLQLRGSSSDTLYFLSLTLLESGRREESLRGFQEALWFARGQIVTRDMVLKEIADLYFQEADDVKAADYYRRAINQNPKTVAARIGLAELLLRDDKRSEAVSLLEEGVKVVPEDRTIKIALVRAMLHGSSRTLDQKGLKEGLQISKELVQDQEDQERINDPVFPFYVRLLIETGDLQAAETEIATALKMQPQNLDFQRFQQQLTLEKEIQEKEENGAAKGNRKVK